MHDVESWQRIELKLLVNAKADGQEGRETGRESRRFSREHKEKSGENLELDEKGDEWNEILMEKSWQG